MRDINKFLRGGKWVRGITGEAMWRMPHSRAHMEMDTARGAICPPEPHS